MLKVGDWVKHNIKWIGRVERISGDSIVYVHFCYDREPEDSFYSWEKESELTNMNNHIFNACDITGKKIEAGDTVVFDLNTDEPELYFGKVVKIYDQPYEDKESGIYNRKIDVEYTSKNSLEKITKTLSHPERCVIFNNDQD
jgi:hypothetical protein